MDKVSGVSSAQGHKAHGSPSHMLQGGTKQNVDPDHVGTTKAKVACGFLCFAAFSHGVLLSWVNPTIPQMENGGHNGINGTPPSHFFGERVTN